MRTVASAFSAHRMMKEYEDRFYAPALGLARRQGDG